MSELSANGVQVLPVKADHVLRLDDLEGHDDFLGRLLLQIPLGVNLDGNEEGGDAEYREIAFHGWFPWWCQIHWSSGWKCPAFV